MDQGLPARGSQEAQLASNNVPDASAPKTRRSLEFNNTMNFNQLRTSGYVMPSVASHAEDLVLRALTEDFGGEVRSSDLGRCLARYVQWRYVEYSNEIQDILRRLEAQGAVTLEATRSGNLIARISSAGIERVCN